MLGGYKHKDDFQNDAHVQEVAKFAASEIGKEKGGRVDVVKVISAHSQVVAGTNYKLILDLVDSNNKKFAEEVTVFEALGGKELKLTNHKPVTREEVEVAKEQASERSHPSTMGGEEEHLTDSMPVRQAAEFAVSQLAQQSNSLFPPKLEEVVHAKEAVADGKMYHLTLKVSQQSLPTKMYEVVVKQSLQKDYTLEKVEHKQ